MKIKLKVKRYHLESKQSTILFDGIGDQKQEQNKIILQYQEVLDNSQATVRLEAYSNKIIIYRECEISSQLELVLQKPTQGKIRSQYGEIQLDLFTHRYYKNENEIVVVYEINQGSAKEVYQIHCAIEEVYDE